MKVRKTNTGALEALAVQRRLLTMEYESEKKAFSELAGRIGIDRLVDKGNAWFPLRFGKSYFNSLNIRVVEVFRTEGEDIEHSFEYGRPVMFFESTGDTAFRVRFRGKVSYVDGDRMVVEIPDGVSLPAAGDECRVGVMLSFDETSYRAMFDALDRVASAKGRLGELRDIIYSDRRMTEHVFAPVGFSYLNDRQQAGVNKVIAAKEVAVVHGPPGTGKTTTLVEAIYETLRRESQVLVCAQSNSAVDLICERLSDRGINVLRIGNPTRVNDRMLSSTYERRYEAHPDYPELWSVRKAIREMRASRKRSTQWHNRMDSLRRHATELEIRINADLFAEARVIAATLVGSDNHVLDTLSVNTLFIDEAAQALEAASWIPVRHARRIILAGDHCQLPPTVKCYEAQKQGLGISLMERIVERHPECVVLLARQYRMHEDIMKFSSRWFYGDAMTAADEVRHRGILDLDTAVEWVDSGALADDTEGENAMSFREALAGQNFGRINVDEAILTLQTLQNYLERIGPSRILSDRIDIAVISPYKAQVRYLRKLLGATAWFRQFRHLITVNTVDGFQGRESDVVIISLVRSNDTGQIGFLRDLRRMNVAMTRARMKLIIIGNAPTLVRHPFYRKLHEYVMGLKNGRTDLSGSVEGASDAPQI